MAIDRGPWNALVDDDGSNLVGTVWNKDKIKTVLLDPIDVLTAGMPAVAGTWTPADKSGAGLVITVGGARYWKLDKLVVIVAHINYPATSNGARAELGDLPFTNGPVYGGLYATNSTLPVQVLIVPSSPRMYINNGTTGGVLSNANLSGAQLMFSGVYSDYLTMAAPHPPQGQQINITERPAKVYGEQYLNGQPLPIGAVVNPMSGDLPLFTDGQARVPLSSGWVVLQLTDWVITNRYNGLAVEVISAEEFSERFNPG